MLVVASRFVAARALEVLPHVVVLGQERVERRAVAVGAVRGDGLLEAAHLALEGQKRLLGPRHERPERFVALGLDGLVERGERRSAGHMKLASVGFHQPLDDLQDGRLPCAVSPHETHDPARIVLPRGVQKDVLRPEALPDVLQPVQHGGRINEWPRLVRSTRPRCASGRSRSGMDRQVTLEAR